MTREMHPRPQFIRPDWTLLDGEWDFAFDDRNKGIKDAWYLGLDTKQTIHVPFSYETDLSGIGDPTHHPVVWYQRTIKQHSPGAYSTLYFEGADYHTTVWLNGQMLGENTGAYHRFEFELENYLIEGDNTLVVRCEDSMSEGQVRGKQRWLKDNFGCWYVQTTGIWKSVWLENRQSATYLTSVKMTPDIDQDLLMIEPFVKQSSVHFSQGELMFEVDLNFKGDTVSQTRVRLNHQGQPIVMDTRVKEDANWGTKIWRLEEPNLYDVEFRLFNSNGELLDRVSSYVGMRKIAIEGDRILLNNTSLYQRLILDQGYWPESGITPPSLRALKVDLESIQKLGYNGLRKHQKIEDERFLYLCDTMGLLVWVEMPSAYHYNNLAVVAFTQEWLKVVEQHYNHPSVITWVPFNESWGIKNISHDGQQQKFTEGIYHLTKALDAMRPVITNDGWEHTVSDILTLHDYEEFGELLTSRYKDKDAIVSNAIQFNTDRYAYAKGSTYKGQPIIISEFGGIAFRTQADEQWGYGNQVENVEAFIKRFDSIHRALQALDYVVGYCYTQLTDVEQEVNGLLDAHRQPKLSVAKVRKVNNRKIK